MEPVVFKPGKVWFCCPSGGNIGNETVHSIMKLMPFDTSKRKAIHSFTAWKGLYIHQNRNGLARHFLSSGCEWQFSIDSDVVFEPEVLYHLLDAADAEKRPIVSALYFTYIIKEDDLRPCWFDRKPEGDFGTIGTFDGGIQKIDAAGMGGVLIHRSVYERLLEAYGEPVPWFAHDVVRLTDGKLTEFGEDLSFFARVAKCGIPVHGVGHAQMGHMKVHKETIESFQHKYRDMDHSEEDATSKSSAA